MVLYTILPINHLLRQTYVQVSFVITSIKIRYAGYVFPNTTTTLIGVLLFQIIDLQLHKVLQSVNSVAFFKYGLRMVILSNLPTGNSVLKNLQCYAIANLLVFEMECLYSLARPARRMGRNICLDATSFMQMVIGITL